MKTVTLPVIGSLRGEDVANALEYTPVDPAATTTVKTLAAAPVDAVAATGTITDGNATNFDVNETFTIGTKVYKLVTVPAVEGDILIGASADASLNNLVNAVNLDGILGVPNTDFVVAAAHPDVTAGAVGSHATVLTAKVKGVAGNAIALSHVGAHGSVSGAHLTGGIDGTVGSKGTIAMFGTDFYGCTAAAGITTAGAWKKFTIGGL